MWVIKFNFFPEATSLSEIDTNNAKNVLSFQGNESIGKININKGNYKIQICILEYHVTCFGSKSVVFKAGFGSGTG